MSKLNDEKVTYFAETDFRQQKTKFGIKAKDRTKHTYILGKAGTGKSTVLENMAIQDIQNDEGLIFLDPHGSSAVKILEFIPKHRVDDVVYFSPNDIEYPFSFNVLDKVEPARRTFVAQGLVNIFKKIWSEQFTSKMEYLLNNALLALLEIPGSTLLSVNRLLADQDYRAHVISFITDPVVLNFWQHEFDDFNKNHAVEIITPIQNKFAQFISNPMIRNILGQTESKLDFRKLMDERKIVIVNLSKGLIGADNMKLIGEMLITKIYISSMSRADLSQSELMEVAPCYFYLDEFQNFANQIFSEILSESRKYKLALIMANQYLDQIEESVRAAILGNVGTFILFRVGSNDATIMAKEFSPIFTAENIINLQVYQIYLRLMIDGVTSKPFSAVTLPPIVQPSENYLNDIVFLSRQKYTKSKKEVEKEIKEWNLKSFKKNKTEVVEDLKIEKIEDKKIEDTKVENKKEEKLDFNFNDLLDEELDIELDEELDWNKEIVTNEEKNILEDKKIQIPEIKEIKIDDLGHLESQQQEIMLGINKIPTTRRSAKLNVSFNYVKSPTNSTSTNSTPNSTVQSKINEIPEDVLKTLLGN